MRVRLKSFFRGRIRYRGSEQQDSGSFYCPYVPKSLSGVTPPGISSKSSSGGLAAPSKFSGALNGKYKVYVDPNK